MVLISVKDAHLISWQKRQSFSSSATSLHQSLLRFNMASREPGHYWWTTAEKSVLAATLGIVIVFGICGNVLVIVAIVRFKRLRRSVNSYLILNLAIADFLTAFLLMPYHLATVLDLSIISGNGMLCKIGGILSYPFYICSTVTLVMLAIERHIAVSDPLRYLSRVTIRTILIMICFAWSQAIFFSLLFLILGNIKFSVESLDCGVAWEGTPLWLSVVAVIMNIALPFILLLIMSLRVMVIARRHKMRIATQTSCVTRKQRKKSVFSGSCTKGYNCSFSSSLFGIHGTVSLLNLLLRY